MKLIIILPQVVTHYSVALGPFSCTLLHARRELCVFGVRTMSLGRPRRYGVGRFSTQYRRINHNRHQVENIWLLRIFAV